jgi:hypothetical protein
VCDPKPGSDSQFDEQGRDRSKNEQLVWGECLNNNIEQEECRKISIKKVGICITVLS